MPTRKNRKTSKSGPAEIRRGKDGIVIIRIPLQFRRRGGRKEIILPPGTKPEETASSLQLAVARAFHWQKMLDTGEAASQAEIAEKYGMNKAHVSGQLRATLLAPDIIEAILDGEEPKGLSITRLRDGQIPLLWDEQREAFGLPSRAG